MFWKTVAWFLALEVSGVAGIWLGLCWFVSPFYPEGWPFPSGIMTGLLIAIAFLSGILLIKASWGKATKLAGKSGGY